MMIGTVIEVHRMRPLRWSLFVSLLGSIPSAHADEIGVIEYTDRSTHRGSWNLIAGGVGSNEIQAELGFSMIDVAYHHGLSDGVTVGGSVGFDYAHWSPSDAAGAAAVIAAPVRIGFGDTHDYGFTFRFEPGLYLGFGQETFSQFIPGIWLDVALSGAFRVDHSLLIGGGIDVPLVVGFPTGGRDTFVAAPILIGPMLEWHFADSVAFTADLKVGPHLMTDDFFGTRFAAQALLGLAFRL
jgi:hypothetical protein